VNNTDFDFLRLTYAVKEKEETTGRASKDFDGIIKYHILFPGGMSSWLSDSEISRLPSKAYSYENTTTITWKVVDSGTFFSYSSVVSTLKKLGYTGGTLVKAAGAISFVEGLSGSEMYEAFFEKLTMVDLVEGFDENHKQWAYDLYTALIDSTGSFGDYSKIKGDNDINTIFAGRIAALADDSNRVADITSGYRSFSEQQDIWDTTSIERRGKYVAAPGHSRHQYGLGADVKVWMLYLMNTQLEKYGLYKHMSSERWHIEPIETRSAA